MRASPDLPPELPAGIRPACVDEMVARVVESFRLVEPSASEDALEQRAHDAINRLYAGGLLEWWGMNEHGKPVYVPLARRGAVVVVW